MLRILFPLMFVALALPAASMEKIVSLPFYSETITLRYHQEMFIGRPPRVEESTMEDFYHRLEARPYQLFLQDLMSQRERLQLNDWLFYRLMRQALDKIMTDGHSLEKDLTVWFLISKAGFDTRLTWLNSRVYVYVYSEDTVYEAPMIEDRKRIFVNLFSINERPDPEKSLYLHSFVPNPEGQAFQFLLSKLPALKPVTENTVVRFNYQGEFYEFALKTDRNVARIMEDYPLIAEDQYLHIPLSSTLAQSLLPQMRGLVKGRDTKEALEILVSFTRSAFKYREDKEYFGYSKPMIPDEVLLYPYSDCEDRSALFFALVRELLDLPMIIVAFSDHLTVAVALSSPIGPAIGYADRKYFICDPTGPANSSEIGRFPTGYEKKKFQIIGQYK